MPPGERIYAIGDIHGRLDLLNELLEKIESDDASRPDSASQLIFLGDLIDRGPESAQVIERLMQLFAARPAGTTRFLLGNHEEVFLTVMAEDEAALRFFVKIGGRETILSYGVSEGEYRELEYSALLARLQQLVPGTHVAFLSSFEDMIIAGDYAFVHAGVKPLQPLDQQRPKDLRWIRDSFIAFDGEFEKIIVHGHTISEEVEIMPHRIGLDTGAYASGKLTAMGFEGAERWILQT